VVLQERNQIDPAITHYRRAIEINPDYALAHWNLATALLTGADHERGWQEFEWRWRSVETGLAPNRRGLQQPGWLGPEALAGKTILLQNEQGLGDTLQFCRYAKLVSDLGARVILEVQAPLIEVLGDLEGVDQLLPDTAKKIPEVDFHCALMSLPLALGTTLQTIPNQVPYIRSEPQKADAWRDRLGPTPQLRVGLVWSGGHRPHRPELKATPGQKNPMRDLKVRQAMWHAIDLDTIQKRVMRGKSRNTGTLVAPPVPGFSAENDKLVAYDPELAKKLLAEAGFPNGFKTNLNCSNDRYINDEQICVAIAAMWSRVGIQADLKTESRSTYFPRMDKGEFDAYIIGWATLPPMDGFSVLSALLTEPKDNFGGSNPMGFVNPQIEKLTRESAVELDEPKRRAMLAEAMKIAKDTVAYIPLHTQPVAWAARAGVEVPQFPDEYVRLWFAQVK
jgi:hypothetical protein